MPNREPTLDVLRDIWHARSQTSAELDELYGGRHPKTCKNMRHVGFGGDAAPVEDDLRAAWRDRLAREGKRPAGSETIGDLLLDPDDRA